EPFGAARFLPVVEGSADDGALDEMYAAVEDVLAEIGATDVPVELVVNKVDLIDPLRRRRLAGRYPGALQASAATGEGLDELRERVAERVEERFGAVRRLLPYDAG